MKMISAFSILFRGLYTHDFLPAQYMCAKNLTWRLYQPPFTWFFNKWKQIEIIKIHAESHEHKQSFIKYLDWLLKLSLADRSSVNSS